MKQVSLKIDDKTIAYNELLDLIKKYLGEYIDDILIHECNTENKTQGGK